MKALASLQLAVVLLATCIGVLAWATLLEKWYGATAAHFAVYDTGWFAVLNGLLAVNVLCAMLIRLPWRWRQVGFVVTHGGILVLLVGCWVSWQFGVEGQLPVYEGHWAHRAYQDSYHFELRVDSENEVTCVPFVSGPFDWERYAELGWFPWRLAYRSEGTIYDEDGITLEVLDYMTEPQPAARVRLTVDGKAEEFDIPALSEDPEPKRTSVVTGKNRRVAVVLRQDEIDLGFQVRLRQFQRKLDPGASMPSHYSSLVDLLDRNEPPQTLKKDVQITLNAPVDFADPVSGRTYRLFQASFGGPWLPGEAEFEQLVGRDRSRDHVYLSRLSVNYDPGRWLKYAGSFLIVIGILLVYRLRLLLPRSVTSTSVVLLCVLAAGGGCAADDSGMDWGAWRRMPAFGDGRVVPVDTFAVDSAEAICGRANPTLQVAGAAPRTYSAAELLFSWLAEPERWEKTAFLVADDPQLREEILGLPLYDEDGRRLRFASPADVEGCEGLERRWAELEQRSDREGKEFRLVGVEKKIKALIDAYSKYRMLTYNPTASNAPQRFYARVRSSGIAWRTLAGSLQGGARVERDPKVRKLMVRAGESLQKLIAVVHGESFSREKVQEPIASFRRATEELAAHLADSKDRTLVGLAIDLSQQTLEMQLALWDSGETLRLVPALNPGALEQNRDPSDDASPWLSFSAMIDGSDDLMRAYPQPELKAVRKAWDQLRAAYGVRDASADKRAAFSQAMNRFLDAVRTLAESIEPLRSQQLCQEMDSNVIDTTAYPPLGSGEAEIFYNRLDPFFWAWVVSLAATLCLLLAVGRIQRSMFWLGTIVLVVAQVFTATGLLLRGYITELVPLTGMFETVVFVALYAALLGLWYCLSGLKRRTISTDEDASDRQSALGGMDEVLQRRPFVLAGAIVSFTALVLAYYAPATVMHRHIGSVTPILRDNFWLAVHVVTIMASYASAAIALILGNMALGHYLFGRYVTTDAGRRPPQACRLLAGFIYTALQITVLLLAAGTILGALWADKAWGRFWAWDPKEVWALISLLVYIAILHARHIGWAADFGMTVAAVLGATAVLFTWYGVNFLLGSGMHSYGAGAGGQWAVGTAVAAQWLFLACAAVRHLAESRDEEAKHAE
jgi:hypothetical protein